MTLTLPLPGSGFASVPFSAASIPAVHYDPRAVVFGMDDLGALGIGKGGQIYRIRLNIPSPREAVASQRHDAHWTDSVIVTAATWSAVAGADVSDPGGDWFYHASATYSKGPLAGKRQFDSPILWSRLDLAGGIYETLNLAQQAHCDDGGYAPDRMLSFTRYRRVGRFIVEVEQAWINHSQSAMPGTGPGTTPLDRFAFPWAVLRQTSLPVALIEFGNGVRRDVSQLAWSDESHTDRAVVWHGLFSSSTGPGVAIVAPQGATVRLGRNVRDVIVEDGKRAPPWATAPEAQYIFSASHRETLAFGRMICARWYLVIGARPDQVSAQAFVRRPHAYVMQGEAPPLPTYELLDNGVLLYSQDPYYGRRDRRYLTDGRYAVRGLAIGR